MNEGDNLLAEIREVNLSYLLLAQRLLHEDYSGAMFRLGLSAEVADLVRRLTLSQTVKLASSSSLLCRFRFDESTLLSAVRQDALGGVLQQAHATLLLAAQPVEAIG